MIKSTVDPACTGLFSDLFLDYIQQKDALAPFYQEYPELNRFKKTLEKKTFSEAKRKVLVNTLQEQYKDFGESPVTQNIEKLADSRTFTVTTGHQLNLMTGPSFFIYKIVSTLRLAEKLQEAFPDYQFVPVYWMASEDHDFEEINHFHFDGKKYTWDTDQEGPVGEFEIDDTLKSLLKQWDFVPAFFTEAYTQSKYLKDAVRKYVHHLFAERGLVIIDANQPVLKKQFLPIIKDDLFFQQANKLVNESNQSLEAAGYKTQIFPREINFFYMEPGRRERLVRQDGEFRTHDGKNKWTETEMEAFLEAHPEKFSPNVVMRPLYQEVILPNLAYLGGPAEVAYWFQLKKVFDHYKVSFPFLLPRNFAVIIPGYVQRKINKLSLKPKDLFKSIDRLRIAYVKKHASEDLSLESEKEQLNQLFGTLEKRASRLDPTLEGAVKAALTRSDKILDQVAVKFRKAEERKQKDAIRQINEVKSYLFPNGTLQERKVNFLEFYLREPKIIEQLLGKFDPLDFNFIILQENGSEGSTQEKVQIG
ncbi:bacillithiol biosynthesis cysteine-adding enzyme BshC [Cyclobacterium jeungdonense]|uniref:Putative cysteine ligase BshC n=1 Tax=Cyclobacterium jeungdonense TaxID=708087 RepID=A0ABT8CA69_9BACT|nr:bacillithiol biosynthesis cysteine-adding enzyme BshC [Cyclobacterium jeungdonense]MDN3689694.1 bacillithiol biosynthesis cysteine-adding enzyme BshC [Cyclobacterium jeungdonense]